jgi:CheY-like chemotaxis protein
LRKPTGCNEEKCRRLNGEGFAPASARLLAVFQEEVYLRINEQVSAGFGVFSTVDPLTALRPTAHEQAQACLRILVVDDQLLYAEAISMLLGQQDGLEVVGIAGDGRQAIEQALALRPDVVLMDIRMPRLDGISATRRIRRRLPATRVLVMTALAGDEHAEQALAAGADACIRKFSRAGDLVTAIEQLASPGPRACPLLGGFGELPHLRNRRR